MVRFRARSKAIQLGTQEAFIIPPGFFIGIDKRFMVTDAPGMFTDENHATRAVNQPDVFTDMFSTIGAPKRLRCDRLALGLRRNLDRDPEAVQDNSADLKGRKIRVLATPLERAVIGLFAGRNRCIPIPYSEVLPSACSGRPIDGVRSSIGVMHPSKFWTVAKHITLTGMAQITCGQFVSTAWLNKLPADLKKIVLDSGKEVTPKAGVWGHDLTRQAEKNWAGEKGAFVHRLSDSDKGDLINRVRPIADKILGEDPETKEIYALLQKGFCRNPSVIILIHDRDTPGFGRGCFSFCNAADKQRSKGST